MTKMTRAFLALSATWALTGCPAPAGTGPGAGASMAPSTAPSMTPSTAPSMAPTAMPSTMPSAGGAEPQPPAVSSGEYTQVERLARPAINEGLLLTPALLDTWNSVMPSVDLTPAAKPIADEATAVLKALGNTDAQVAKLFGALLPDVMRIDVSRPSGYAGTKADPFANVEPTKGIPVGGRLITDDVIDVTLFLIVPDATNAAVPGLRSDNVGYDTPDANGHTHKPLSTGFPFLAAPN